MFEKEEPDKSSTDICRKSDVFPLTRGNGRTTGTQKPSIQAYHTPTRTAIEEALFPVS